MTPTLSPTSGAQRCVLSRELSTSPRRRLSAPRTQREANHQRRALGRYIDEQGRTRELIAQAGAAGSVLVIDRDRATRGDQRLVAHLAADEPAENAAVVCSSYLEQAIGDRCRCRLTTAADARTVPFAQPSETDLDARHTPCEEQLVDCGGWRYELEAIDTGMSIRELRWCRTRVGTTDEPQGECHTEQPPARAGEPVSLRDAIAAIQSYEPPCTLTIRALTTHAGAREVSTTMLRAELVRVQESPIVLNRRLREVVLARVSSQELSMSEIAMRCGRVKRDRRGNESGETSWLARRLGLLPEGGRSTPTPWIHSDVLALIARSGLGVSPREVEL
jgi:hypothetical protein